MAGQIVEGQALTEDGKNIFHELSTLEALTCAYAGFSVMCWENPGGAGELQTEQLNAGVNSFVQRATDILWTRIYQHLHEVLKRNHPNWSEDEISIEIQVLVAGMDLWT